MPKKAKAFTTTIKAKYLKMKLKDLERQGFFYEYKEWADFWTKRLNGLLPGAKAVFLSGSTTAHTFKVAQVDMVERIGVPEKYRAAVGTAIAYRLKIVKDTD